MSIEAMKAALKADGEGSEHGRLSQVEKHILHGLANHAGPTGRHVYPGVPLIMEYTHLSERAVRRAMSSLRERGILKLVSPASRHSPDEYEIDIELLAHLAHPGVHVVHPSNDVRGARGAPRGAPQSARGAPESGPTLSNHHRTINEPSSSSPPANGRTEQDRVRGVLETSFCAITRLDPPERKTDAQRKEAATRWWGPLRRIATMAQWSEEDSLALMHAALKRAAERRTQVAAPQGIIKYAEAIAGEIRRGEYRVNGSLSPEQIQAMLEE